MTPKSKRKSILVRMLRPVSVAFGEFHPAVTVCLKLKAHGPSVDRHRA